MKHAETDTGTNSGPQNNGGSAKMRPNHRPIKVGTLQDILKDVAAHHGLSFDDLLGELNL
jgi:hypothetical protein